MGKVWDILEPRNLELGPVSLGAPGPWRHWKLARDDDGIAWLVIDKQGASANTLSEEVLVELNNVLGELERDPPKGLVLRSAKRGGFIAGADIGEFRGMTDVAAIETRLTVAHGVVDRLDQLKVPTVAVIHGYCLGGGLEIALACDHRIALEDARLGFPEVMLGLHPGLGGTVRLPRLINPVEAMTLMLTGRNLRAGRAKVARPGRRGDPGTARARRRPCGGDRQAQARAAAASWHGSPTARPAASSPPSACVARPPSARRSSTIPRLTR